MSVHAHACAALCVVVQLVPTAVVKAAEEYKGLVAAAVADRTGRVDAAVAALNTYDPHRPHRQREREKKSERARTGNACTYQSEKHERKGGMYGQRQEHYMGHRPLSVRSRSSL
jgi:hypothetical protein